MNDDAGMNQNKGGRQFGADEYPLQELTNAVIAAAIYVHRKLGPGYLEQIYENALVIELESRGRVVERQKSFDVYYKGFLVGQHRLDLLVDDQVVLELKSVEALAAIHVAQLRSILKASGKRIGLLMNFNQPTLAKGLKRVIL
ncbi:MAG: GxxExxY protein [Planctomycetaceae bacterium]|nr:GxxExxY protein [Planctomycetaceae bacterium]